MPVDRGDVITLAAPKFLQAIGVMAFAYVCHHNSFLVYQSLADRSARRYVAVNNLSLFLNRNSWSSFRTVTFISVGAAACAMFALGVGGYLIFGHSVQGSVDSIIKESRQTALIFV